MCKLCVLQYVVQCISCVYVPIDIGCRDYPGETTRIAKFLGTMSAEFEVLLAHCTIFCNVSLSCNTKLARPYSSILCKCKRYCYATQYNYCVFTCL